MAAFTTFERETLERHLIIYGLGELVSFEAIAEGIENSNYFVSISDQAHIQDYVLTITEALSFEDVPFFNDLMARLSKKGIPVPVAQRTLDGMSSTIFCGKPTWLFSKLEGSHLKNIGDKHCFTIGKTIAEIHLAAADAKYSRANPYASAWVNETIESVKHRIDEKDLIHIVALSKQYAEVEKHSLLPRGIIHGDVFTDNALYIGDELGGIIDFYHACNDFLLQDIAVTINDWCKTKAGQIDETLKSALLKGYESVRELTEAEVEHLILFQKFAALRFSLTRFLSGTEDAPLKNPDEFLNILRNLK